MWFAARHQLFGDITNAKYWLMYLQFDLKISTFYIAVTLKTIVISDVHFFYMAIKFSFLIK